MPTLIEAASHLHRAVTVSTATKEGPIFPNDFQARKLGVTTVRGHMSSLVTFPLERIAEKARTIRFTDVYSGFVKTGIARGTTGPAFAPMKAVLWVVSPIIYILHEEVRERMLFLASSEIYCCIDRGKAVGGGESLVRTQ